MKTLQDGLKEAIKALNSIRNTRYSGEYDIRDSYALIPELERILRENPLLETSDNRVLDAIMATVSKPPTPPVKQLVDMLRKAEAWINDECERRGKEDEEYESPAFEMVDEIRAVLTLSQSDIRNLPKSADPASDSVIGGEVETLESQVGLDICRMLTLSYKHLRTTTGVYIIDNDIASFDSGYGCLLHTTIYPDDAPADLKFALGFAKAQGCDYLRFDIEGRVIPQLPTYE